MFTSGDNTVEGGPGTDRIALQGFAPGAEPTISITIVGDNLPLNYAEDAGMILIDGRAGR